MRLHRIALIASLAFATVAACSSFTSDDSPPAPDDGGDVVTAPPPVDAGTDGASFCSSHDASFCWSFDETGEPLLGTKLMFESLGTVNRPTLTDASLSPPFAMLAETPDGSNTSALKLADDANVRFRCDFAIFVEKAGANTTNVFTLFPQTFLPAFELLLGPNGTTTSVGAAVAIGLDSIAIANVPFGEWTPMALEVVLSGATATATGSVNGVPNTRTNTALEGGSPAPVDGGYPPLGAISFDLGLGFSNPGWRVRYDDVVCNWD